MDEPPYSQPLCEQFCQALVDKVESGEVEEACVLVNNATETGWFQNLMTVCSAICFLSSRVKFIDKNGNASGAPLQGQAVLYVGSNVNSSRQSSARGEVVSAFMIERGVIRNKQYARQIRDFSGIAVRNITPTDIDGFFEMKNEVFVSSSQAWWYAATLWTETCT